MEELGINDVKVISLYQEQNDDKGQRVKEWVNYLRSLGDNTVVLTSAFVSIEEFPESDLCLKPDSTGRKLIHVDDVIERECEILEAVGFTNVNDFVRYEYKEAYIWPNEVGKKIIGLFKKKLEQ